MADSKKLKRGDRVKTAVGEGTVTWTESSTGRFVVDNYPHALSSGDLREVVKEPESGKKKGLFGRKK